MQTAISTTATTALATTPGSQVLEMGVEAGAGLAIGVFPSLTALAAAEIVTANIIRLDTGAVIGTAVLSNQAAGASGAGPLIVIAPIPVGMAGAIALTIFASVATGNFIGAATSPISLTTLP